MGYNLFNSYCDIIHNNITGRTAISCRNLSDEILAKLDVVIIRKPRIIDTIFTVSVVILVSLVAVNFGCTMDWTKPKEILKKPVGPIAGFCGQFIFMPLVRILNVINILDGGKGSTPPRVS